MARVGALEGHSASQALSYTMHAVHPCSASCIGGWVRSCCPRAAANHAAAAPPPGTLAGYGRADKRSDPAADSLFVEAVQLYGKDMKVGRWGVALAGMLCNAEGTPLSGRPGQQHLPTPPCARQAPHVPPAPPIPHPLAPTP